MGIEFFIPTERRRNARGVLMEHPVIPCLVFIRTTKQIACDLRTLERLPVQYLFDYTRHTMLVVPDKQMNDFIRVFEAGLEEGGAVDVPLVLGERIRITRGALRGVEGNVLELSGKLYVAVGLFNSVFAKARILRAYIEKVG